MKLLDDGILTPCPGRFAATPSLVVTGEDTVCYATIRLYTAKQELLRCYVGAWRRAGAGGWLEETMQWIGDADDGGHYYAQPMVSDLGSGRLLLTTQRVRKHDREYPSRFNPITSGLAPTEMVWMYSEDGGRTWTPPVVPDFPDRTVIDAPCNIVQLQNGDWLWGCERWKGWDDAVPVRIRGFALRSSDRGASWFRQPDFPGGRDDQRIYSHSKYVLRHDGRIASLKWTTSPGMSQDFDLHYVEGDASGTEWSSPRATGIPGQNSWLLDHGNGVMAAAVAIGDNDLMPAGVYAVSSDDDGRTWDRERATLLWPASNRERKLFSRNSDSQFKVAFGQVAIAPVDGGFLCTWSCLGEDGETCLRYAQLELVPRV